MQSGSGTYKALSVLIQVGCSQIASVLAAACGVGLDGGGRQMNDTKEKHAVAALDWERSLFRIASLVLFQVSELFL